MFGCHLILPLLIMIPLGQETAKIRVRITVYEVPFMIVSRTIAARVAEDGSVVGTMVGGSTTGSFPAGVAILQNQLAAGSYSMDIKQVWLRWQDPYGIQDILNDIPERLVFDQTVSVKFGQTTLVGFPSSTSRSRRSIFWLALSVEKPYR